MTANRLRNILSACFAVTLAMVTIPVLAQTALPQDALFQSLGGNDGIKQIVEDFLSNVLSDVRIKKKFDDVDMAHLAKRLAEQFCELSGGPCKYAGKDMKTIHADLGISNAQFNALAEDLQLAMEKHGVSAHAQNKLLAKLAPMQHSIVTK
jgi:hemoglobin